MQKTYNVFISSASRDKELVRDLTERLEQVPGVRAFSDKKSVAGEDWTEEVKRAIEHSDEVLYLVTEHTLKQPSHLAFEVGLSESLEKPITPILLGVESERVPAVLADHQAVKWSRLKDYIDGLKQRVQLQTEGPVSKRATKHGARA
jgi:hypothetical protein